MTYTEIALVGVVASLVLDHWVLRTRVTSTKGWWLAYAIIVFFQLLTNGWLTGREIVRYNPDDIIGSADVALVGDGRLLYAPVEDLLFGFALVLTSVAVWVRLGARRTASSASGSGVEQA